MFGIYVAFNTEMIFVGLDIGTRFIKVVFIDDGREVLATKKVPIGFEEDNIVFNTIDDLSASVGIKKSEISKIEATGCGRDVISFCDGVISETAAAAKAVSRYYPEVRTIIDVGAEESKAIKIDSRGMVLDTVINDKCAAGSGAFTESMARILELSLDDFARISLESDKRIPMNAQCTVFAESEVISLIHSGVEKKDIAKAVHDAIASRVASMARRLKVEPKVMLIGGMAYNIGFISSLKAALELDELIIPEKPEFINAIGAALYALE